MGLRGLHQLAQLDQREFHQQLLATGVAVIQVTGIAQIQCAVIECGSQFSALHTILLRHLVVHLQQFAGLGRAGYHQVTQVLCQAIDKELRVKALVTYLLVDEQGLVDIPSQEGLDKPKVVVIIEHVEVVERALVGDMPLGGCGHLVKDGEGVAHSAVGLLCDDVEGRRLGVDALMLTDVLQLLDDIGHGDAREIINLATRQDGRDDLLLLGGGKDKDGIFGRFFQRLEEGIEGSL